MPISQHHLRIIQPAQKQCKQNHGTLGIQADLAGDFVALTSVVRLAWHVSAHTEATLRDHVGLEPAVAWLVYGRLTVDIANVAAEQRSRGRQDSQRRTVGDLDALITAVRESVDINGLDAAVRAGVARTIDYTRPSNLDRSAFFAGVDVTPAHVAANLDVMRVEELSTVAHGLGTSGHVVIVGPSGSGKSALMWRAGQDVGRGARPLQVLRCSSDEDVTLVPDPPRRRPDAVDHDDSPGGDAYTTGGLSYGDGPTDAFDDWDIVMDSDRFPAGWPDQIGAAAGLLHPWGDGPAVATVTFRA